MTELEKWHSYAVRLLQEGKRESAEYRAVVERLEAIVQKARAEWESEHWQDLSESERLAATVRRRRLETPDRDYELVVANRFESVQARPRVNGPVSGPAPRISASPGPRLPRLHRRPRTIKEIVNLAEALPVVGCDAETGNWYRHVEASSGRKFQAIWETE